MVRPPDRAVVELERTNPAMAAAIAALWAEVEKDFADEARHEKLLALASSERLFLPLLARYDAHLAAHPEHAERVRVAKAKIAALATATLLAPPPGEPAKGWYRRYRWIFTIAAGLVGFVGVKTGSFALLCLVLPLFVAGLPLEGLRKRQKA